MRLLITGGAGFIGSHLTGRLLARGDEVTVVDDFNDYYDPAIKRRNLEGLKARVVRADIRDTGALEPAFSGGPEVLVHLAARAGVRPSLEDPALYSDVNVRGTLDLLERCRRHGVKRLVFASSSSVYGNAPVPFREDSILEPVSPYGATKLAGEHYVRVFSELYGIQATCLRFFTAYGPRQRPDMAIHKFAQLIESGAEVPFFGTGETQRDYTYIDDIVDGVIRAIDRPRPFAVYNLGESRTVKLVELIGVLEKSLGKKAKLKRLPNQPGDARETCADIGRARRELGYDPKTGIEDGVENFVRWLRSKNDVI